MLGFFVFCLFVCFLFVFTKNTPLEISLKKNSLAGVVLLKDFVFYIFPGVFAFYYGYYSAHKTFFVTEEYARDVSYLIVYASFAFIGCFYLFSKMLGLSGMPIRSEVAKPIKIKLKMVLFSAVSIIFFLTVFFHFFGLRNAIIESVFGADLGKTRLGNRYSGVPTFLLSYYHFLVVFSSVVFGAVYDFLRPRARFFCFLILLYSMTFLGNKSIVFYMLISIYISKVGFSDYSISPVVVLKTVLVSLVSFFLFIAVAFLQIGFEGLDDFFSYLFLRGFMGQVGGAYESFSLGMHNPDYVFHSIPFANVFTSYPIFNKDLMMLTWGAGLANETETGVMNSFFIGEAFAIGGYELVFMSPVIVAFNFAMAYYVVTRVFRKFFNVDYFSSYKIVALIIPWMYNLTADVSGMLFGKLLVMIVIFLVPLFLVNYFLKLVWRNP